MAENRVMPWWALVKWRRRMKISDAREASDILGVSRRCLSEQDIEIEGATQTTNALARPPCLLALNHISQPTARH